MPHYVMYTLPQLYLIYLPYANAMFLLHAQNNLTFFQILHDQIGLSQPQ